jgi:hypothetical protein
MRSLIFDFVTHWQPVAGLCIGVVLLAFVAYINWYGTVKADIVHWIGKSVFRNGFRSEASANGLFMVGTSIFLAIGWIWTGLALMYIWNG